MTGKVMVHAFTNTFLIVKAIISSYCLRGNDPMCDQKFHGDGPKEFPKSCA